MGFQSTPNDYFPYKKQNKFFGGKAIMLYYLPLEPYNERYTALMSCKDGWAENHFNNLKVPFKRIEGTSLGTSTIKNGVVLDACGRSYFAMSQIMEVVKLINDNVITENDVIYLEDFWHPGVESLFYIRHLLKRNFKIGTFIHAQSVDDTDFAYAMRDWMRHIEKGFGNQFDYVFTCSDILRHLCIEAGVCREDNIFTVGLPYNSERLLSQVEQMGVDVNVQKEKTVLFASRFDKEKDPYFFLALCRACPDVNFVLVNPRKDRPISNDPSVVKELEENKPSNLTIVPTFNKKAYYEQLAKAKIVFNCADQDWVSWTLLEAVTFKAIPLYPTWKDFPLELKYNPKYLYIKHSVEDAKNHLYNLLDSEFNNELNYIVEKHDNSWKNYLKIMGLLK